MPKRKIGQFEDWAVYLAARLMGSAITSFNIGHDLKMAKSLGRLWHNMSSKHRDRTLRHLTLAFPDHSRAQIENTALKTFEHFAQVSIETLYTPRLIYPNTWPSFVRTKNLGETTKLLNSNEPSIVLSGHIGNWEVLGTLLSALGIPIHSIARPINHQRLNDYLIGVREAKGMSVITKWDASDVMVDVLRSGGTLGFIADQNAGDGGVFVPWFGRLASSYKSIGLLAMTHNAPVICGCAARIGSGFHYEVSIADIIRPDDWADQPDPLYYIVARYNRALESMVRRFPTQFVWMHRRWRSRPRYEYKGKPMTASMQRKLEGLPWMDEKTMEGLKKPMDRRRM